MLVNYYTISERIELRSGETVELHLGLFPENDKDAIARTIREAFDSKQGTITLTDRTNPQRPFSRSFAVSQIIGITDTCTHAAIYDNSEASNHAFINTTLKTHSSAAPKIPSIADVVNHDRSLTTSGYTSMLTTPAALVVMAIFSAIYYKMNPE